MVQVRALSHLHSSGEIDLNEWAEQVMATARIHPREKPDIVRACEIAQGAAASPGGQRPALKQSFHTGLEMAEILADFHLDKDGLIAAILYRAVREEQLPLNQVGKMFGEPVATLIGKVLQMAVISMRRNDSGTDVFGEAAGRQAAKLRQLMVAIIDDVRVALIKLAERTCAIRSVKNASPEKRTRVAREVFDVYAPLAHRLGVGHLKWELEDLAFRYLQPDQYTHIAKLLDERRLDRQTYIENVIDQLQQRLVAMDIRGEVLGRVKHIYSIWRKMYLKGLHFSRVYDIRAVRVLVPTIRDCYAVLSDVHERWHAIPEEFDDYIAQPKENGYRSLHTAVVGPDEKVLEIQIRTFDMHQEAEFGVCAHWAYKGSDSVSSAESYEAKIGWMRQVLEWQEELESNPGGLLPAEAEHPQVKVDRIYAFTPQGHVVDLPAEATPLDFAYRVHTSIGHRCRGAKVNGRIVPLNTRLQLADQVEILTGKEERPSRDWLSQAVGYLCTSGARQKVQQWFRKQDFEKNALAGRQLLEKEFRRLSLKGLDLDTLGQKFNKQDEDGLYAAIGAGDIGIEQVVNAAQSQLGVQRQPDFPSRHSSARKLDQSDVYIYGVGNLATRIAGCCHPIPGEPIVGYITHGRGVSIHRSDCGNLLRLQKEDPARIMEVSWGGEPEQVYPAKLQLEAYDRRSLLKDVSTVLDKSGLNVLAVNSRSSEDAKGSYVTMGITVEVPDLEVLSVALARLQQIPNVYSVHRADDF
jgi:GTP pyrophosphokinase